MVIVFKLIAIACFANICANSNEDALFASPVPTNKSRFLSTKKQKDNGFNHFESTFKKFTSPKSITNEDLLFSYPSLYSPTPPSWLDSTLTNFQNHVTTVRQEPAIVIGGSLMGIIAGYHYANIWSKIYQKSFNLLENKPILAEKIPQNIMRYIGKTVSNPMARRAQAIYYMGEFCVLTALYSAKKAPLIKETWNNLKNKALNLFK